MTIKLQIAFATFALTLLATFAPLSAYAMRNSGIAHTHTQTPHDRSPTVHEHGSHSHHG
jgi:hypothetical protein